MALWILQSEKPVHITRHFLLTVRVVFATSPDRARLSRARFEARNIIHL